MKKLIVLLLVLGLASVANAHFIFTVDGVEQGPEVWIAPSEIIELDLELSADEQSTCYDLYYVLNNNQAELIVDGASGSYPGLPPMTDIEFPTTTTYQGKYYVDDAQHVEIYQGTASGEVMPGGSVLMRELYLHCLEPTDVTLTIEVYDVTKVGPVGDEPIEIGTILHTLIIHQIPEPATMLLLGLGGLLLRRRR